MLQMELGWAEVGLLCLSSSTFMLAIFLLFWVMLKGGYQTCVEEPIDEKSGLHSSYYRTSSPSDILYYSTMPKPPVEVQVTSPDGSTVSEQTRERILASHPHFWDNVSATNGKQLTYGSFRGGEEQKMQKNLEALLIQQYSYSTIKLNLTKDSKLPDYLQLFSTEMESLSFHIRELYLEFRCLILHQDQDESDKQLQELYEKKTKKSILNRLKYSTKHKHDAYSIHVPVSKMRKPFKIPKKLLFSLQARKKDQGNILPEITATCYVLRNGNKAYIGKGNVIGVIEDITEVEKKEDTKTLHSSNVEVMMEFIHDPKYKQGKALLSLTFLPTGEKLSIDIKELVLEYDKEKISESTELYWRITFYRSGKRRSKRKLNISLADQNRFIWTCNTIITFDRVSPEIISSSFIVCKLMTAKSEIPEELSSPVISSGTDSSPTQTEPDDSQMKKDIGSTLGEVYIGCNVPDSSCRDHWLEMLKTPRIAVEKWQDVI